MQPRHVIDVLSLQWELRETAQRLTDDVNEARFLVHKVVARALNTPTRGAGDMREELAALAAAGRRAELN